MKSLFESLFTTKDIVRKKYPGGWVGWVNDNMSDEDDGRLTRFTTMDGRHMYSQVQHLIKNGFTPPELVNGMYCELWQHYAFQLQLCQLSQLFIQELRQLRQLR